MHIIIWNSLSPYYLFYQKTDVSWYVYIQTQRVSIICWVPEISPKWYIIIWNLVDSPGPLLSEVRLTPICVQSNIIFNETGRSDKICLLIREVLGRPSFSSYNIDIRRFKKKIQIRHHENDDSRFVPILMRVVVGMDLKYHLFAFWLIVGEWYPLCERIYGCVQWRVHIWKYLLWKNGRKKATTRLPLCRQLDFEIVMYPGCYKKQHNFFWGLFG